MNIIKKASLILCILTCMISCIEPIDIKDTTFEDFLIVEAQLTDELKQHTIKLSRTFPLDSADIVLETGASVVITDNLLNTYNFTETTTGIYISDITFKAIIDRSYVLEINTANGKSYTSNSEKIAGLSNVNNLVAKKETNVFGIEGLNIYVESNSTDNLAKYYKYNFDETYKVIPPNWSGEKLRIVSDELPFEVEKTANLDNNKICYTTKNSNSIIQTETASLSANNVNFGFLFIPKSDFRISSRYSILLKQSVQSLEAFNYYNTLSDLSSSENVFTQNQPGFLLGNITATNNNNDKAIGYFEVNSVSEKRLFLNRDDFYPNTTADFIDDCEYIAPLTTYFRQNGSPTSPLISILKMNEWLYYKDNDGTNVTLEGEYFLVPKVCGDCRETGTNIKPSFWID